MSYKEVRSQPTIQAVTIDYGALAVGQFSSSAIIDQGDGHSPQAVLAWQLVTVQANVRFLLGVPGGVGNNILPDGVPAVAQTRVAASGFNNLTNWSILKIPAIPGSGAALLTYTLTINDLPRFFALAVINLSGSTLSADAQALSIQPIHHYRIPA